jgi:capsule polysaccharide export protein KpsE/RkpR
MSGYDGSSGIGKANQEDSLQAGWLGSLLQFLIYLVRHWKAIIGVTFCGGLLSILWVLNMTQTFQSNCTLILTAGDNSPTGALAKLAGGDLGSLLTMSNNSNKQEMAIVLGADTLAMRTIRQFHLERVWKMDSTKAPHREDLLRGWGRSYKFEFGEMDELKVAYEDESPVLAQQVLIAHIRRVDSAWLALKRAQASDKARFAQERLDERLLLLQRRADSLIQFQIQHKIFDPDEQIRQTVLAISGLEAKISGAQINQEFEKRVSGGSKVQEFAAMSSILQSNASQMIDSQYAGHGGGSSYGILLNLSKALPLAAEYEKKTRLVQLDLAVVEGLARQVEQLKIEAMRDVSVLEVVDPAVVPSKRKSPPRMILVFLHTCICFIGSCTYALLYEYFKRSPKDSALLGELLRAWR